MLFIFDFALLLAIPNMGKAMTDPNMIPDVLTATLGSGFTKLFFAGAMVSVFSTAIATLATIVRMIYGMARNGQLPGSGVPDPAVARAPTSRWARSSVAVVLSIVPLIFIKRIPVIVAAITALIIIPYILVLGSLLVRRLQGWPRPRLAVQPGQVGPADHRGRPGLDGHHPVGRGLAAGGHQSRSRAAAGDRGPGDRHARSSA